MMNVNDENEQYDSRRFSSIEKCLLLALICGGVSLVSDIVAANRITGNILFKPELVYYLYGVALCLGLGGIVATVCAARGRVSDCSEKEYVFGIRKRFAISICMSLCVLGSMFPIATSFARWRRPPTPENGCVKNMQEIYSSRYFLRQKAEREKFENSSDTILRFLETIKKHEMRCPSGGNYIIDLTSDKVVECSIEKHNILHDQYRYRYWFLLPQQPPASSSPNK